MQCFNIVAFMNICQHAGHSYEHCFKLLLSILG